MSTVKTKKLEGKVAVITGGSTGIGLATAKLFAAEGAHVFITGRREKELSDAVKAIGGNVTAVQGDVTKLADIDKLYATVKSVKGRIDVLYANAGTGELVPIEAVTEEHYDHLMGINVKGALFTIQKALPLLAEGASIILTGSVAGVKGLPQFTVYNATKAAVRSFARTLTTELSPRKIRVNVVSPGPIDTPLLGDVPKDRLDAMAAAVPLGRIGKADEVAKAALFLASDDSSYITGVDLFVDGGMAQV